MTDRALCLDGRAWLSVDDLTGPVPRGGTGGVLRVGSGDLAGAARALVAAQRGATVAVLDDGPCAPDLDRLTGPGRTPRLVVQTSGSTSRPRAVVRTAASWQAGVAPFTEVVGLTDTDVLWAPGGPGSTMTLFALWHALAERLPLLATGPWRGVPTACPVPAEVTVLHAVPPVALDVLAAHAQGLLPALRTLVVAGAVMPPLLRRQAQAAGLGLVEYYGAAELSFVAVDRDGVGLRPFPGCEVQVRDDGQIWVHSPHVALGYLDPDDRGPLRRDADGWCTVGDRAEADLWRSRQRLVVQGRAGEAVTVGGHTVVTADVEAVLGGVDGVLEAVCVGQAHDRLGECVVLVVRADAGADPLPALREAARRALPAAARPVRYVVVDDLPRTAGGKVARAAVRALVAR